MPMHWCLDRLCETIHDKSASDHLLLFVIREPTCTWTVDFDFICWGYVNSFGSWFMPMEWLHFSSLKTIQEEFLHDALVPVCMIRSSQTTGAVTIANNPVTSASLMCNTDCTQSNTVFRWLNEWLACFILWGQILVFKLLYICIVLTGQIFETHPVVPILTHKHVNTL